MILKYRTIVVISLCVINLSCNAPAIRVGLQSDGRHIMPTQQVLRPAGVSVEFAGRPVDLVLSPDGKTLYVKDDRGLVVIDTRVWKIRQELKFESGGIITKRCFAKVA